MEWHGCSRFTVSSSGKCEVFTSSRQWRRARQGGPRPLYIHMHTHLVWIVVRKCWSAKVPISLKKMTLKLTYHCFSRDLAVLLPWRPPGSMRASLQRSLWTCNPNKLKTCESKPQPGRAGIHRIHRAPCRLPRSSPRFLIRHHEERGDKIIVFSDNIFILWLDFSLGPILLYSFEHWESSLHGSFSGFSCLEL